MLPMHSHHRTPVLSLLLALALGACGDDATTDPPSPTDAGRVDTGVDAGGGRDVVEPMDTGLTPDTGADAGDAGRADAGDAGPDAGDAGRPDMGSLCGNGTVDPGEDCDDGSRLNGRRRCGQDCRFRYASACVACENQRCGAMPAEGELSMLVTNCFAMTGNALAGPGIGVANAQLCADLVACQRATKCSLQMNPGGLPPSVNNGLCLCGTVNPLMCLSDANPVDGRCRDEVLAACEYVPDPVQGRIPCTERFQNPMYPVGNGNLLTECAFRNCFSECFGP